MNELDEILRLAGQQLKAGRAHQARSLATVAQEMGDIRANVVLAVVAGALGESWPTEPPSFDATCFAIGLPLEESRACLSKAMTMAGVPLQSNDDKPIYKARP
jgi:hypothetical protein